MYVFERCSLKVIGGDIHICNTPELLHQVPWQESYHSILARDDLICSVDMILLWSMFLVEEILGEVLVDINRTRRTRRSLARKETLHIEVSNLVIPTHKG